MVEAPRRECVWHGMDGQGTEKAGVTEHPEWRGGRQGHRDRQQATSPVGPRGQVRAQVLV